MRKVISTILKIIEIIAIPFAIFGAGVLFQIVRYMFEFYKEHRNDYGPTEEELYQFQKDGAVSYFEDLADNARNL